MGFRRVRCGRSITGLCRRLNQNLPGRTFDWPYGPWIGFFPLLLGRRAGSVQRGVPAVGAGLGVRLRGGSRRPTPGPAGMRSHRCVVGSDRPRRPGRLRVSDPATLAVEAPSTLAVACTGQPCSVVLPRWVLVEPAPGFRGAFAETGPVLRRGLKRPPNFRVGANQGASPGHARLPSQAPAWPGCRAGPAGPGG
jgi:hypothetical protein